MTTNNLLLQERPPEARDVAPDDQPDDAIATASRRFALTGDDSELVALGVLPVGKPLLY